MIAFRYTKCDGAEYLSHLDLFRSVYRTLRRAGAKINFSEGYHRHPKIFLNNPLPTGIKSTAEYGAADCLVEGDFRNIFNCFSPKGVKCLNFEEVDFNPNFAATITSARYFARGARVDEADFLNTEKITVTDLKGRETDLRPKIIEIAQDGSGVTFTAYSGERNLRPDLFCAYLDKTYGGKTLEITKVAAFGNPLTQIL